MHYFFYDVHLGLGSREKSRERERELLRFLEMVGADRAESLYIVGDLFDYWFDYRSVIPREFVRTVGAIAALADAGVRVEYVIGNHDFGHKDFFEGELGVHVHHDDIERTIAGRRCYISHGDGKAFNDTGYVILKKILRAPLSNRIFRFLHPDIGIGIAMRASHGSRLHTDKKNYLQKPDGAPVPDGKLPGGANDLPLNPSGKMNREKNGLYVFAENKIVNEGFDLVVMGHSHAPQQVDFPGGTYVNLGTWLKHRRPYLIVDQKRLEFRDFALRNSGDDSVRI
jgi:UDP-2,3-diacylglucosamine hydrolase